MPGLVPDIRVLLDLPLPETWTAMTMQLAPVNLFMSAVVIAAWNSPVRAQTMPGGFVFLRDIAPSIIQDIRYAGSNNFMGRPIAGYGTGECVVKREVGLKLEAVQQDLARQ